MSNEVVDAGGEDWIMWDFSEHGREFTFILSRGVTLSNFCGKYHSGFVRRMDCGSHEKNQDNPMRDYCTTPSKIMVAWTG